MAYKIIYKKRFQKRLFKLLDYLKSAWGEEVADEFIIRLQKRLQTLSKQPYIGAPSSVIKPVRSILITKHNRLYYRIKDDTIEVLNMYDTRRHPRKSIYL
ncbi:type II toxin-antitoxin system RelE/ParE family toxin [Parafilimonas terrae]|uniref:Plasmid stabilization system protein ParE n=1 Tax=Parafilimonas terrae TaxID=1465490 RepID=A0A1I5V7A9_9BACT|nr:type II toxin-antitoxin system RelE/ParE family toxin [Parafilimonas terrae]SFQ03321.1 Plasmid stabilization system protein ParE [Parafilimonas terrae]